MATLNYPMMTVDLSSFDLDDALTMPQQGGATAPETVPPPTTFDVSNMPTVEAAADVCPVCMEGFRAGRSGKQVPCGHVYHQACISEWSLRHNSCPLCRSKIFQQN